MFALLLVLIVMTLLGKYNWALFSSGLTESRLPSAGAVPWGEPWKVAG